MNILRIEYDDNTLDIMDAINKILKSKGLVFECDNLPHDGWEIYELKEIEDETRS